MAHHTVCPPIAVSLVAAGKIDLSDLLENECDRCGTFLSVTDELHYPATWPGDDAGKPYSPTVQRRLARRPR